jgi:uncharacterized membrane protein
MALWWFTLDGRVQLGGLALLLTLLAFALPRARRLLDARPALASVAALSAIGLPVLWRAQAAGLHGVDLHLLGVALVTLMLGPWLAAVAVTAACLFNTFWRDALWANLGIDALLMLLPVATMQAVLWCTRRFLPRNIFVFNLGVGMVGVFIASAAALALQALALIAVLPGDAAARVADALPYGVLLMWGEGLTSGLLVAVLTAYRPQWIASFDDAVYLRPPR